MSVPYEDELWRAVCLDAPPQRIRYALRTAACNDRPEAAEFYLQPARLNGLLCWTGFERPEATRSFLLRYGLDKGCEPRPHSLRETSEILGVTLNRVSKWLESFKTQFWSAHHLLRAAPEEARCVNELRAIGLRPQTWLILAQHGGIFTLDQLKRSQLQDITKLGPVRADEIRTLLSPIN